ncbi:CU044_5270 family protein [Actinomadura fibrosa]|uniref:CU044_5270 family protein n=1 Tax=Actinomadura fibrosa TaxID=111802 RepID=A0ABW2XZQ9_9ACTN|nr:CU044_5270 family protein [Actinomadura fibrosa]
MNDVQETRRLLAPANPCPPGHRTGAAHDETGRAAYARITAAAPATTPRRTPSRRTALRLAAVGGLAVATAAGITVAQSGGVDGQGRPRLPGGSVANAQEVLYKAADTAQTRPFKAPAPTQWVFTETRYRRSGVPARGQVVAPGSPLKTVIDRQWIRADGTKLATLNKGKLETSATGGGFPPVDYASVSKLPRDPSGMLAWARANRSPVAGGRDASAFQNLSSLLLNNAAMPPAQTAAAYRALAAIPGVRLDRTASDDQGRRAFAVSMVVEGWVREEILIDPSTYTYRGHRDVVVRDHTFEEGGTFKKGAVESSSVRLASAIVDRPGQR